MTAVIDPTSGADAAVTRGADWRMFGRCLFQPSVFDIVEDAQGNEPPYPTAAQADCCNRCPVRTDCLNYALDTRESAGVWGGMTTYQRELLIKVQSRKSCPGCSSKEIILEGIGNRQHEVCVSCGISWPA